MRLLDAAEVADMLGVSKEWVWQESRAGRIPTVDLGRYRRYRPEAIEDWIRAIERGTDTANHVSGRGGAGTPPGRARKG